MTRLSCRRPARCRCACSAPSGDRKEREILAPRRRRATAPTWHLDSVRSFLYHRPSPPSVGVLRSVLHSPSSGRSVPAGTRRWARLLASGAVRATSRYGGVGLGNGGERVHAAVVGRALAWTPGAELQVGLVSAGGEPADDPWEARESFRPWSRVTTRSGSRSGVVRSGVGRARRAPFPSCFVCSHRLRSCRAGGRR